MHVFTVKIKAGVRAVNVCFNRSGEQVGGGVEDRVGEGGWWV